MLRYREQGQEHEHADTDENPAKFKNLRNSKAPNTQNSPNQQNQIFKTSRKFKTEIRNSQ